MSDGNLNLQDLMGVNGSKPSTSQREDLASTKSSAVLRGKVAEKSKLIQWDAVLDVVQDKTVEMLNIPLITLLYPEWKKYQEIRDLADPKKHPADEVLLVSLAEHTMELQRKPVLVVSYRGLELTKIEFTLTVQLRLQSLVLKIQDGKIKEIKQGTLSGKSVLLLEDKTIIDKSIASVDLPGRVDLGEGISLRGE